MWHNKRNSYIVETKSWKKSDEAKQVKNSGVYVYVCVWGGGGLFVCITHMYKIYACLWMFVYVCSFVISYCVLFV